MLNISEVVDVEFLDENGTNTYAFMLNRTGQWRMQQQIQIPSALLVRVTSVSDTPDPFYVVIKADQTRTLFFSHNHTYSEAHIKVVKNTGNIKISIHDAYLSNCCRQMWKIGKETHCINFVY